MEFRLVGVDPPAVEAKDDVDTRVIASLDDLARFLADRARSLDEDEHAALGYWCTVLAVAATGARSPGQVKEVGRRLDAWWFSFRDKECGQAFDRAGAEAEFVIGRAPSVDDGVGQVVELLTGRYGWQQA